jgi:hypothetical protein
MPDDFRFDVFLSHNAQDKPRVRRLAERLKKSNTPDFANDARLFDGETELSLVA